MHANVVNGEYVRRDGALLNKLFKSQQQQGQKGGCFRTRELGTPCCEGEELTIDFALTSKWFLGVPKNSVPSVYFDFFPQNSGIQLPIFLAKRKEEEELRSVGQLVFVLASSACVAQAGGACLLVNFASP